MRLLERYILGELLRVFGMLVTVSTALLVFVGVFGQAREHDLGYLQILQILPFVVPSLLPYTIPATLLLAVCVVYGRMSGDNEVIAAKAAGISVLSLMWPSFFLGALLSVAALLLSDQIIPWAFGNIERVITLAMEDIFIDHLRTQNTINVRGHGITITVTGVRDRTLIEPVIRYSPKGRNAITVTASAAKLSFDLPRQQVWLELHGAQSDLPGKQQTAYLEYDRIPFPLPTRNKKPRGRDLRIDDIQQAMVQSAREVERSKQTQALEAAFALSTGNFDRFTEPDFRQHVVDIVVNDSAIRRMRVEHHNRFAMAVSCLFFVLLGSPFAIFMARKEFLTSFLFCFLPILIVYYPVSMLTQNMSKTGSLDPTWAVWTANGLLGLAASYFLRRVTRN